MGRAALAEPLEEARSLLEDRLAGRHLAVEHPERVALDPLIAVAAELTSAPAEPALQLLQVGGAAGGVTDGVELQLGLHAEPGEEVLEERDLLGVDGRLGDAEGLAADLVELAVAPLLRPLPPEHRPQVEPLLRPLDVGAVLDEGADRAGGPLGAEAEKILPLVLEDVHLLVDDVRRLADAAREERVMLHDRRPHLAVAVERE